MVVWQIVCPFDDAGVLGNYFKCGLSDPKQTSHNVYVPSMLWLHFSRDITTLKSSARKCTIMYMRNGKMVFLHATFVRAGSNSMGLELMLQ